MPDKLLVKAFNRQRLAWWWMWGQPQHFFENADGEAFELVVKELRERLRVPRFGEEAAFYYNLCEAIIAVAKKRGFYRYENEASVA
jgi:hypothetical protein